MDREEKFQRLLNQTLIRYNTAYEKSAKESKGFISPIQCPRCGNCMPINCGLASISRISDEGIQIYVCSECGIEESKEYIPITDWEIAKKLNE